MRADIYLTTHGYYDSRARAQAAIKAGLVLVDGKVLKKPSDKITDGAQIEAEQEHPWVSRGGVKLAYALKHFDVSAKDKICLDIGASTGGFSEVLYENGAAKIYAVDVGHSQLHPSLQKMPRLISMEGTDARNLTGDNFDAPPQLIVCDASFISAMKVLDVPLKLAAEGAELITLVKPQFEVGKSGLGKGGLVKSEALALQALSDVSAWVKAQGWSAIKTCASPIIGGSGNTEYLLHAKNKPRRGEA